MNFIQILQGPANRSTLTIVKGVCNLALCQEICLERERVLKESRMKKTIKKVLALTLSAAMTFGLAACGSGSASTEQAAESSQTAENTTTDGSAETVASGETIDVYWFSDVTGWGPGNWNGTDTSPVLDAIREQLGITFTIEQPPTDADTKLGLMIASGELPDLISITNEDTIKLLIESGKVWTIQELLEQYDPESHLLTDFPEDIKESVIRQYGDWWFYPSHMNSNDNMEIYPPSSETYENNLNYGQNTAIMFNQTMMDELGLTQEDVQTEEALLETLEVVQNSGYTVDGQSIYPVMLHGDQWISSSLDGAIAQSYGVLPVDAEGNYRHRELDPAYKSALKLVNEFIQNGYLDVNSLTIDEAAMKTYIESGRVFCWIGNPAQSSAKNEIPWVSYGPIVAENEARPTVPINQQAGTGWIKTFVSKDCENPEAIAKLLSYVSTSEALYLNEYGIEGEDYVLDENGLAVRTEEGQERYESVYQENMWLWPINNTNFEWGTQAGPEEGSDTYVYSQVSTALGLYENTYIYDLALLGFEDSTVIEPSSDLGIKYSQLDSYLESQKAKIISAASDDAFEQEYANMISTLEEYSISEIDAAYNEKLQEYCEMYGETIENVNAHLYE